MMRETIRKTVCFGSLPGMTKFHKTPWFLIAVRFMSSKRDYYINVRYCFVVGFATGCSGWLSADLGEKNLDAPPRNTFSLLRPSPSAMHKSAQAVKAATQLRAMALPTTALVTLTLLSGPCVAGMLVDLEL